jgi:hypothetical protein
MNPVSAAVPITLKASRFMAEASVSNLPLMTPVVR